MRKIFSSRLLSFCFTVAVFAVFSPTFADGKQATAELYQIVEREARAEGVDPALVWAIMQNESAFKRFAVSHKNAMGLMQLIPSTATRFGVTDVFNETQNIRGGVRYLKFLLRFFDGNVRLTVAAYNAGEGAVQCFLTGKSLVLSSGKVINPRRIKTDGIPPYAETITYVRRVLGSYQNLLVKTGRIKPAVITVAKNQPKENVLPSPQSPSKKPQTQPKAEKTTEKAGASSSSFLF